jgi:hypothetical protein
MELQGTVAIVTDGNGGLGQRICYALAQAGSHIAVVYTQASLMPSGSSIPSAVSKAGLIHLTRCWLWGYHPSLLMACAMEESYAGAVPAP